MSNAGLTYKYTSNTSDNYGIVSSYILYNSIVQTDKDMDLHSKTTLFKDTINTEVEKRGKENRGKGNQKGKED